MSKGSCKTLYAFKSAKADVYVFGCLLCSVSSLAALQSAVLLELCNCIRDGGTEPHLVHHNFGLDLFIAFSVFYVLH